MENGKRKLVVTRGPDIIHLRFKRILTARESGIDISSFYLLVWNRGVGYLNLKTPRTVHIRDLA